MALDGNVPMLIWLGKQMLGQKDKFEHSDEGARQNTCASRGTMEDLLYHQVTMEQGTDEIDVEPQRALGRGNGHAGA